MTPGAGVGRVTAPHDATVVGGHLLDPPAPVERAPMTATQADDPPSEWRALHRVGQGGVTKVAGVYLDHDHPIPDDLVAVFGELAWSGWLSLAAGDALWDARRVGLTDAGQARYAVLRERYAEPDPQFGAVQTSAPG